MSFSIQPVPPRPSRTTDQSRTGPGVDGAVHSTQTGAGCPLPVMSVEWSEEMLPPVAKKTFRERWAQDHPEDR